MTAPVSSVVEARSPAELDQVRDLIRAFVAWHRQRHVDQLRLIDDYFDPAAIDDELASLPGRYARPSGRLLLAQYGGEPAGCVGLKAIDAQACEMKRMFVSPQFQGLGIGRALAEAIVAEGRDAGYQSMWLDTSVRQTEAQSLYRSMGFETVDPYYEVPPDQADWLVFMRKNL
jgi:ribosomal protein S18 acetylase RimI-like enzyme